MISRWWFFRKAAEIEENRRLERKIQDMIARLHTEMHRPVCVRAREEYMEEIGVDDVEDLTTPQLLDLLTRMMNALRDFEEQGE